MLWDFALSVWPQAVYSSCRYILCMPPWFLWPLHHLELHPAPEHAAVPTPDTPFTPTPPPLPAQAPPSSLSPFTHWHCHPQQQAQRGQNPPLQGQHPLQDPNTKRGSSLLCCPSPSTPSSPARRNPQHVFSASIQPLVLILGFLPAGCFPHPAAYKTFPLPQVRGQPRMPVSRT